MSMSLAAVIIILIIIILAWRSAMRARELAVHTVLKLVKQWDVQLLDDTVCLTRMRLSRQSDIGSMCLFREYAFEYSVDGVDRYKAFLQFNGYHFLQVISNDQKLSVAEVQSSKSYDEPPKGNNIIDLNNYRTQHKGDVNQDNKD